MIKDYKIIYGEVIEVNKKVVEAMKDGWQPFGSPFQFAEKRSQGDYWGVYNRVSIIGQAVVKYDKS